MLQIDIYPLNPHFKFSWGKDKGIIQVTPLVGNVLNAHFFITGGLHFKVYDKFELETPRISYLGTLKLSYKTNKLYKTSQKNLSLHFVKKNQASNFFWRSRRELERKKSLEKTLESIF